LVNIEVKSLAYTSLIGFMLEYATAAWDPYRAKDINKLDGSASSSTFREARLPADHFCFRTNMAGHPFLTNVLVAD